MRVHHLAVIAAASLLAVGSASAASKHRRASAPPAYDVAARAAATSMANAPKSVIWSPSPKAVYGWSTEVPPQYVLQKDY